MSIEYGEHRKKMNTSKFVWLTCFDFSAKWQYSKQFFVPFCFIFLLYVFVVFRKRQYNWNPFYVYGCGFRWQAKLNSFIAQVRTSQEFLNHVELIEKVPCRIIFHFRNSNAFRTWAKRRTKLVLFFPPFVRWFASFCTFLFSVVDVWFIGNNTKCNVKIDRFFIVWFVRK